MNRWKRIGVLYPISLLLLSSPSYSQSKNGSYYCVAEWVGGGWFNSPAKRWEGRSFRPTSKFVIKMKFDRTDLLFDRYDVTIIPSGSNEIRNCWSGSQIEVALLTDYIKCEVHLPPTGYIFNLRTNRFVTTYEGGYTFGDDNNDDTPTIEGGTCTKIGE